MKKMIALTILFTLSNTVLAAEPMSDYHFQCQTKGVTEGSKILIKGGVDPSGLFSITTAGSGQWKLFQGLQFLSQRHPLRDKTNFVNIDSREFKFRLSVFWNKKISSNTYSSSLLFQNPNMKTEIPNLICKVTEDSL